MFDWPWVLVAQEIFFPAKMKRFVVLALILTFVEFGRSRKLYMKPLRHNHKGRIEKIKI